MNSDLWKVNWWDIGKASINFAIGVIVTGLLTILEAGNLPDWNGLKVILIGGAIAGLSTFFRRFLTNSDGKTMSKEPDVIK